MLNRNAYYILNKGYDAYSVLHFAYRHGFFFRFLQGSLGEENHLPSYRLRVRLAVFAVTNVRGARFVSKLIVQDFLVCFHQFRVILFNSVVGVGPEPLSKAGIGGVGSGLCGRRLRGWFVGLWFDIGTSRRNSRWQIIFTRDRLRYDTRGWYHLVNVYISTLATEFPPNFRPPYCD